MTIKTQQVKIYPNRTMTNEIDKLFNYRRYCWNLALETWNNMYQQSKESNNKHLAPNNAKVRNYMVANKQDWQYNLSARVLQYASSDLEKAWKRFFNKISGIPKFKSKKNYKPSFTTDRAKIRNDKLVLDKPRVVIKLNGTQLNLLIKLDIRAISNYV